MSVFYSRLNQGSQDQHNICSLQWIDSSAKVLTVTELIHIVVGSYILVLAKINFGWFCSDGFLEQIRNPDASPVHIWNSHFHGPVLVCVYKGKCNALVSKRLQATLSQDPWIMKSVPALNHLISFQHMAFLFGAWWNVAKSPCYFRKWR